MLTRILFAEDDFNARTIVSDQLVAAGFQVEAVADGADAIERLQTDAFDLLLLDILMPRKDGLDVLRWLKHQEIAPRVIMLTGIDDLATAVEAVKLGASDYVTKPFAFDALLASIERVLAR
jgi:DNA-binding response OmpR family regulator